MCSEDQKSALLALFGGGANGNQTAETLCGIFATQDEFYYDSATGTLALNSGNIASNLAGTTAGLNTLYLVVEAALVFVMHAGFAMVRACLKPFEVGCQGFSPAPLLSCSSVRVPSGPRTP